MSLHANPGTRHCQIYYNGYFFHQDYQAIRLIKIIYNSSLNLNQLSLFECVIYTLTKGVLSDADNTTDHMVYYPVFTNLEHMTIFLLTQYQPQCLKI